MWQINQVDLSKMSITESDIKTIIEEINELSVKIKVLQNEKEELERDRDYWMDQAHSWMDMYYGKDLDD